MAANSSNSIFHRIWIYSKSEAQQMRKTSKDLSSQEMTFGTVITEGGIAKPYTSIILKREDMAYPDSVIVAEGDIRKVHYTPHML